MTSNNDRKTRDEEEKKKNSCRGRINVKEVE
jgi:hypothetical protein